MTDAQARKAVVLVSGAGTNLQALLDASCAQQLGGEIVAAISNRPNAGALERAQAAGIQTVCVDHTVFPTRGEFDLALATAINRFEPDLLILAGFMRILGAPFIGCFENRMLNIHPSLLPKYPGLHTHRRALEAGDAEHGATIHFVTNDLDGGPPVLQGIIPLQADDNEASLSARVQQVEHKMYPLAVNWFLTGRLRCVDGQARLDGEPLPASGVVWNEEIT